MAEQTAGIRAEISATQRRLAELNAELENAETDLRASTPPAPTTSSPSPTTSAASSAPDAPAGAARPTTTTTAAAAAPAKDARANLGAVWATFSRNPDAFGRRELRPLVRQGVPVELRREVWPRCARIHKFNQLGFYGFMAQSPFRRPSAASKTIELDLLRTLPSHVSFSSAKAPGIAPLRRILTAYSRRNPQIGYCQGMSMVAAGLLLHLEEEQAYWMLCAVIENVLPADYYTPGMLGMLADQQVLTGLLAERLPELHTHFAACHFDAGIVTTSWFITLFMECCPLETVFRIWDILFCEGSRTLFAVALAIFRDIAPELYALRDPGLLGIRIRQACQSLYVCQPLIEVALDELRTLRPEDVATRRDAATRSVRAAHPSPPAGTTSASTRR